MTTDVPYNPAASHLRSKRKIEHMTRVRAARFLIWFAIIGVLGMTSGCGSRFGGSQSTGPLHNVMMGGKPNFSVAWSVESPGQSADMTAFVVNSGPGPVTLVSASLVPISGQQSGLLTHLAIGAHHDALEGSRGWPPVPGIPLLPFKGSRIPVGQTNIIFGFEGTTADHAYMNAGLKVLYRYRGQLYTMTAWASSISCVVSKFSSAAVVRCSGLSKIAKHATEKLAGV